MKDLTHPRWMWLKAALLVAAGLLSAALVVAESPSWKIAALLAIAVWAFCRAYYFAFYVIEHYIDPSFRYAGLWDFVWRRCLRHGRSAGRRD